MYEFREMTKEDWPKVATIYEEGIATGLATFATSAPTYEDWDKGHRKDCRIVICEDNEILGWAAVGQVFSRCVYNGVVELSLYIAKNARGKGVGSVLLKKEIEVCEKVGIWTIQSLIFSNNEPSLAMHKKGGFNFMCVHKKLGCDINGEWRDVTLMEYRSKINGV